MTCHRFPSLWVLGLGLLACQSGSSDAVDPEPAPEPAEPTSPILPDAERLPDGYRDVPLVLPDLHADPARIDYYAPHGLDVEVDLIIEPGVVIAFAPDTMLLIDGWDGGSVQAVGTAEAPIVFTSSSPEPGAWGGIYVDGAGPLRSRLQHLTVEYGGGLDFDTGSIGGQGAANLGVRGEAEIEVSSSTFRDSGGFGIEVQRSSALLDFTNNHFERNAAADLSIPAEQLTAIDDSNTLGPGGLRVTGGSVFESGTWPARVIRVADDIELYSAIVIEPGTTLELEDRVVLSIQGYSTQPGFAWSESGSLIANGTPTAPVVFTNAPGNAWARLYFDWSNAPENRLSHVHFVGGGVSPVDPVNEFQEEPTAPLLVDASVDSLVVRDCTFVDTRGDWDVLIETGAGINDDIGTANTFDRGVTEFE